MIAAGDSDGRRGYYDLYTLFRRYKDTICIDILKSAVLHTAEKRTSMDDIRDWKEILTDIRQEPQMRRLWSNYTADNPYIVVTPCKGRVLLVSS